MAPTFPHMLSSKKHSWIFACSSSFRRLQTCATGAERPPRSHRAYNVSLHARYQYTDNCSTAIRDFAGCKPALPERRGHLGLIVHTTFPYMHGTNTQINVRLQFEIFAGCKPALPERRGHLGLIVHTTFPYMHGTNTQINVRLQFEISQVANLRYRSERPPRYHHGPKVSSHAQFQKAQLDIRLQFKFSQVANLRYRSA